MVIEIFLPFILSCQSLVDITDLLTAPLPPLSGGLMALLLFFPWFGCLKELAILGFLMCCGVNDLPQRVLFS